MYFSLVIWLIFLMLICSKIKQKHWKIIFSKISSILVTLELGSIYLTDRLVDYRVYTHFNIDAIEGYGFQFITHAILFGVVWILVSLFLYFGSKRIEALATNNKFFVPSILVLFVILSWPGGVLNEAYKIYEILGAEEKSFNDALVDLGISPEKYITPDQLEAIKGKNIIVISIESLEQGFMGVEFDNIAPNLSRLSNELTYYNKMPQLPGAGWTAGSLYSHQVGIPAFFKGNGNAFFQEATDVKLTGLGHILNVAGYQSRYLIGNDAFAGTSDLLSVYGIQTVSEKNSLGNNYEKVHWGFHDLDLFREAKLQIKEFDNDKPFALFLSTVNTHFPNGIYDKRMEKMVPRSSRKLEFSVMAVDYLINDFIEFLKQENLYENSAIFIFPDHLLMGSSGDVIFRLKKSNRQLYLISNIDESDFQKETSDTLYQTDLPRMIVDGAKIETNAVFFSDFHREANMIKFVDENKVKLTTLNSASLTRRSLVDGFNIRATAENITIRSGKDTIFEISKGVAISLTSSDHVTSKEIRRVIKVDGKDFLLRRGLNVLTEVISGRLKVENFDTYGSEENANQFLTRMEYLIPNNKFWAIVLHDVVRSDYPLFNERLSKLGFKVLQSLNGRKAYLAHSDNSYGLKELSSLTTVTKVIEHNINKTEILDITFNAEMVMISSRRGNIKEVFKLNRYDKKHKRLHVIIFIVDGVIEKSYFGNKLLTGIMKSGPEIKYSKDEIHTISNSNSLVFDDIERKQKIETVVEQQNYRQDRNRFIAHAGGQIDGYKYTNSLEAMDLNYKKGFRLFELDIIETLDNIYVAGHDWKHWKKITGYKGDLPPDRNTFKQQKIYGKYSLMDIEDINEWFKEHDDAILVTDKINTPLDFSNKFIDKKRLMMELFTWDAVEEGLRSGIKSAMPTFSLLGTIKGDKLSYLKQQGVTDIASSRRIVHTQKELIRKIVTSGINIYAFHLHFDKGMDEKYVVCNERKYFYGMYADQWSFNKKLDCESP